MEKLNYLPVLMYHNIIDKTSVKASSNYCIEPRQFERQMDYLVEKGYNCINCEDLENILQGRIEVPEKPIMITFDDAYSETLNNVVPLLAAKKIKSVFTVVTGYIGRESSWEKENSSYLTATEDQIKKLAGPLVTFESHTKNHLHLAGLSLSEAEKEMVKSKEFLESITGRKVRAIFYPYGSYNENVKRLAAKAGYLFGFVIASSKKTVIQDLFEIRRVYMKPSDSLSDFKRKIAPWYIWYRGRREASRAVGSR